MSFCFRHGKMLAINTPGEPWWAEAGTDEDLRSELQGSGSLSGHGAAATATRILRRGLDEIELVWL